VSKPEQDGPLARKLEALLARAHASASSDPDPTLHHQLGDVYAELGRRPEALTHYGKAIDGFMSSGRVSVAVAICTKVVKRYPNVTRTHFTLGCGAMHQGRVEESLRSLSSYVDAALASDTTGMAIPRMRLLAALCVDRDLRVKVGGLLERLGDEEFQKVTQGEAPPHTASLSKEKRQELLIELATSGSDAVWSGYWLRG
jgi:hypothetical protein